MSILDEPTVRAKEYYWAEAELQLLTLVRTRPGWIPSGNWTIQRRTRPLIETVTSAGLAGSAAESSKMRKSGPICLMPIEWPLTDNCMRTSAE